MDKETSKKQYWFRRENHLCTKCGCEMPDGDTRTLCEFCRGKNKQRKELRKSAGNCIKCGKEDAYTINKRSLCAECACKNNEWHKKRRREGAEWAENELYQHRKKYNTRKQNHLCVECGKKLREDYTYFRCDICRRNMRLKYKKYNPDKISRSEAHNFNLCVWCVKRPATYGKLCEQCYPKSLVNISKAQQSAMTKNTNHPWRLAENARVQEVRRRLGLEKNQPDKK